MPNKPCRYPGCAAGVVSGDACPVHTKPIGARWCDTCHGAGSSYYSGQDQTMACQRRGGTGFKDAKTSKHVPRAERVPVDKRGLIEKASE